MGESAPLESQTGVITLGEIQWNHNLTSQLITAKPTNKPCPASMSFKHLLEKYNNY